MKSNTKTIFKSTTFLYLVFFSAVSLWCSLIIAAPLLAKYEYGLASGITYLFFSKICHQMPERSFFILGKQFAVCSRCTGLYFGFLLGTIIYPLISKFKSNWIPAKKYFFLAGIPISIDIFIRFFRIAENTFTSRLITGLILGAITVFFVLPGFLSISDKSIK
ncbi:DUF2085 domain-containing protein [candidate division KSB1 bacterium]|nr:DUF2085 domain-containing protein [candidate division KSB1 bacterium]MBL7092800.1 DUF2085 domain-containing protein [candidate division KSB1 bacterium]